MSTAAFKEFAVKVMEDEELKAKAKEIGMENVDGIIALAKENGYDVSMDDLIEMAKELQPQEELSDDDLDKVAGGFIELVTLSILAVSAAIAVVTGATAVSQAASGKFW